MLLIQNIETIENRKEKIYGFDLLEND